MMRQVEEFPTRSDLHWQPLAAALLLSFPVVLCASLPAAASTYDIRPIFFETGPGISVVASGTITTGGSSGVITGWNIALTTTQHLASYSKSNTVALLSGVSADADGLSVQAASDAASDDGGSLVFRAPSPGVDFGTALAEFSGASSDGGSASFIAGGSFDALALGQAYGTSYRAATPASGSAFTLVPLDFSDGVSLSGTITTNGKTGALSAGDLKTWRIDVAQVTRDVFTETNSVLSADLAGDLSDDMGFFVVNPGGLLSFDKPTAGGETHALVLADFTDPTQRGGLARYVSGPGASYEIGLGAETGRWIVSGTDPIAASVPLPAAGWMALAALTFFGAFRRRA